MGRLGFLARVAAASALTAAAAAGAVGLAASRVGEQALTSQLASRLEEQASLLADGLPAQAVAARDREQVERWALRAGLRLGERVTVVASDGSVLGDSEVGTQGLESLENHAERSEVRAALSGRPGTDVRLSRSTGRAYLYAAVPVAGGVLRLAMPLADVNDHVADLRQAMLGAGAAAALAALALGAFVAWRLQRPLSELAAAADRLSAGDFTARADPGAPGELGRLAVLLNELAARVAGTVAALSADKARLEATLAHMVEGVALVGGDGRVETLNPAMEALFGLRAEDARGRTLPETLRHPPLAELAGAARAGGEPSSGEITLFTPAERVFAAHAVPVRRDSEVSGVVLVLHEITRLRRLEELRKEFVANVSHELRTPLASIKGFAETLRRGALEDPEVRLEFVTTIEEYADQLTALVDDLLELAAVEGGRLPLKSETVDLEAAAAAVLAGLAPIAEPAETALSSEIPAGLSIQGDGAALGRVLRNLVENAVKYNRRGGRVTLSAAREGTMVRVSVADNGIGIPAADLPRLFERFYRVDKARSRERGGTGLGLSIVKHLVEAMGGAVRAESVEGEGSTFSFTLPAA
ncbi:MAG: PAS domain-containing protein [Elusimicrobia bacterium]|nr:PAS domain-containing protein [Elusimicrobiota bacterium]